MAREKMTIQINLLLLRVAIEVAAQEAIKVELERQVTDQIPGAQGLEFTSAIVSAPITFRPDMLAISGCEIEYVQ